MGRNYRDSVLGKYELNTKGTKDTKCYQFGGGLI